MSLVVLCSVALMCLEQVLLSRKLGDLRATAKNGDTALHSAARNGQVFVTALLLLGGSDDSQRNAEGMTPRQLAKFYGHTATSQVWRVLFLFSALISNTLRFSVLLSPICSILLKSLPKSQTFRQKSDQISKLAGSWRSTGTI